MSANGPKNSGDFTRDLETGYDPPTRELRAPYEVPGYKLIQLLGRGSFGEVWHGIERNTLRQVAIKFFVHESGLDWPLMKREVSKLVQVITERRIVQLLEVGWDADPPYYVMEYLEGGSLADRLSQGPLPLRQATSLFREVVEGLVYLHDKAILHCDLKPANVLLDGRGEVRLADFGQVRMSNQGPGQHNPAADVNLFYLAPELTEFRAQGDARSDVYALGALFYAMLTGAPPLADHENWSDLDDTTSGGSQLTRYREIVEAAPPIDAHRRVAGMDRPLAEIVDRCLARYPEDRYESARQVLEALQERDRRRDHRPLVVFGIFGPLLLLAALGAFGIVAFRQARHGATDAVVEQTLSSASSMARTVAAALDRNLSAVHRQIEREASREPLRQAMTRLRAWPAGEPRARLASLIQRFSDRAHSTYKDRHIFSWALADPEGLAVARSPYDENVVGRSFDFREWFSGIEEKPGAAPPSPPNDDGDPADGVPVIAPRTQTGWTLAFRSVAEGQPMLISAATPVWSAGEAPGQGEVIGVAAATLGLDTFHEWIGATEDPTPDGECPERIVLLAHRGQLVRHPCPRAGRAPSIGRGAFFETEAVQQLVLDGRSRFFRDPQGRSGKDFLAVARQLDENPDWTVFVLHDREAAIEPVVNLTARLGFLGFMALVVGLGVVAILGFMILRLTSWRPVSE